MSRASLLDEAARERSHAPALTDGQRSWTFGELAEVAQAFGASLVERSDAERLGPGVCVAMVLDPTPAGIVALHGVWSAGAVMAPLNPRLTAAELAEALDVLKPAVIVTARDHELRVAEAARPISDPWVPNDEGLGELVVWVDSGAAAVARGPWAVTGHGEPAAAVPAEDLPRVALWTSGTSGRPRGVLLSEAALRHSVEAARDRLELSPEDRWYASLSLAHVGGLALVVRAALLGSAVVTAGKAGVADLSDRIDAGVVTHTSLVPVVLQRLLERRAGRPPPASLRCLLIGGGPAYGPLVARAVEAGYPVALTYGLTEATSQVATAEPALVRRKPGTVGSPLPGVEVRVATDSEILVRGPTLAVGTLGGAALSVDDDGWLHTGDLGELDDEGHLWITGRRSDRIVTGGFTVDPAEVVAVLEGHPSVQEAAVLGVPDPEWGERVVAVVVADPAVRANGFETLDALCRARLASAKVPRRWVAADALPRTSNGKVDRKALAGLVGAEEG
jgi:O-succinylbenzoic acid--CoA ligase